MSRPRVVRAAAGLVLVGSALSACTGGSGASDAGTGTATGSVSSPPPASVPTSASPPAGSSFASSAPSVLALSIDGLVVVVDGSSRPLDFGADRASVTSVLTLQLGTVTTTRLPECGQGPRTSLQAGDLVTLFDGDSFVGWEARGEGDPPLTTLSGIGVGSTLAEVDAAFEVSVSTDTLGPEFFTRNGQFGGFLTGQTPDATVTELHAGETCFFR